MGVGVGVDPVIESASAFDSANSVLNDVGASVHNAVGSQRGAIDALFLTGLLILPIMIWNSFLKMLASYFDAFKTASFIKSLSSHCSGARRRHTDGPYDGSSYDAVIEQEIRGLSLALPSLLLCGTDQTDIQTVDSLVNQILFGDDAGRFSDSARAMDGPTVLDGLGDDSGSDGRTPVGPLPYDGVRLDAVSATATGGAGGAGGGGGAGTHWAEGRSESSSYGLRHCTAHFPAGKLTVVVGPRGCGKSSLLRLLLPRSHLDSSSSSSPSELTVYNGAISLQGRDWRDWSPATLRARSVYLPEEGCDLTLPLGLLLGCEANGNKNEPTRTSPGFGSTGPNSINDINRNDYNSGTSGQYDYGFYSSGRSVGQSEMGYNQKSAQSVMDWALRSSGAQEIVDRLTLSTWVCATSLTGGTSSVLAQY